MQVLSYCKLNLDLVQHAIPKLMQDQRPVFAYLTDRRHYDIGTFKGLGERGESGLNEEKTSSSVKSTHA